MTARHRHLDGQPEPTPRRSIFGEGASLASVLREALLRRQADRSGRYVLAEEPRPCWHCGQHTRFIEVCFEAPLCPGACTEAKEIEYWRALAASARTEREERLCEDS